MTPEQRITAVIDERASGLWSRWYESGPDDVSRGWDRPFEGLYGPYRIRIQLTRGDVRDLQEHIYKEHGRA